eukprot:CAMPEP_0115398044 /NCGR_PEP_ID=MMETSP0271-20121206/14118_1 /TAXON_ID=71861 /ORGANISM="Scrippsiella trochoidea, Strain CCMP3099" /LENGTH=1281 /DNA_ID=CAMNT_0002821813 /DNA_START=36 /DNA_END=3881 /DNA_ORIENTATION=-
MPKKAKVVPTDDPALLAENKDPDDGKTKEDAPEKGPPPVSVGKMFSMASSLELLLLLLGTIGAFLNGAVNPAMIYVWGRMIDAVGPTGPSMAEQVKMMLLIGVAALIASTMQAGCFRMFAQIQSDKMRKTYYETLLNKDISWFDMKTTASLAAEVSDDADKVAAAFGDKFANGVQGFFCFIMCIFVGFFLGWQLSLVILAAVPLMAIGMIIMGKAVQEVAQETQSWYSTAAAKVEECLFAVRTVIAFGGERKELEGYSKATREAKSGAVRNYLKTSLGSSYAEWIWALANAVALYFGMTLVYGGKVNGSTGRLWTGGDILIIFFCVLTGGFTLGQLEPANKAFNEGRVSMARFFAAKEAASTIQCEGKETRKVLRSFESFEFREVRFSYPARPTIQVLKGLSLKIEKGQKVAVVGESGSGKSTVMSLLERFYDPNEGFVMVNGEELTTFTPSSLRAMIGYVGQEPVLFATSVRDNIMQGWPSATEADMKEACKAAQLQFIDALPDKYETNCGSGGSQFSGGQKQRIAIARAMLRKPKVLFLDEATSALDSASERMIQETIDSLSRDGVGGEALTTVAIAHRLSTVRNSDMIFVLKDGALAEKGTHDQLMEARGQYYALAAAQETAGVSEEQDSETPAGAPRSASPDVAAAAMPGTPAGASGGATIARGATQTAADDQKEEEERVKKISKEYKMPMGRLLGYNKPEWWLFVPGILGAIVHGANNPVQAYLLVGILDALYMDKETMKEEVTEIAIQFVILGCIVFVASSIHMMAFGILSEAMTQRLRVAILTSVFRQEVGWHDDPANTPGLVGTALQLWAYRVRNLCANIEANASVFASLVLGLVIAFVGCWQMALAMLGAIPVLGIASSIQMYFMMGGTSATNDKLKSAQQIVSDSVQNARTVQACGMEKSLVERHNDLVGQASKGFVLKAIGGGMAFGLAIGSPTFIMAFGFWYSEDLVKNGNADFKGVMLAFMGILYAAMGAGQFTAALGDGVKAKVACHDMFKLMDRESPIDGLDPTGKVPDWASYKTQAGQIEFENVQFFYPFRDQVKVLKGVTFKIEAGQSVGLVGPSGGGKSTIMALIQRFYDPQQGTVYIGGKRTALSSVDIRWWRKQVGFVGQEPILFNTTVKENVLYGLDKEAGETITEERLVECKKMAHLNFIDEDKYQGWETQVGPRGGRLSGGQKQRVAICRALVRDPPVLLLDEATSALDTESEKIVQEALEKARCGRTSFAIAHRLSTIQDCDVILVTAEGVIVEKGSHAELMEKKGVYYKLHGSSKK